MRIYELAKELSTDSKSVIQILKEKELVGTVRTHMSNVDAHQQGVVRQSFGRFLGKIEEVSEVDVVEPTVYDVEEAVVNSVNKDESEFGFVKGTAGTTGFATFSDEDRLETEEELSFGQKAFAKAEKMKSAEDETFEKLQEDAWAKKIKEADRKIAEQTVIVEKPSGFFGWLKGLFL